MSLNIDFLNAGNYYGKNSIVKNSANAGESVATLFKQGRYEDLKKASVQYSAKENGKVSIDGALAYSRTSMAALDKNHDGILDAKDGLDASLIKMVGGNKGYINNADNTAYTMLTDRLAGNIPDGVLTPEEVNKSILPQRIRQQAAQEKAMGQTESAAKLEKQADELEKQYSKEIQGFVKGMKLEERDKALVMPKKSETPGNLEKLGLEPQPVKDNNEILKLLKQLIKLLMPNQSQESQAKPKEGNIFNFNGATNANFNFQGTSQEQNDFEQLPLDQ